VHVGGGIILKTYLVLLARYNQDDQIMNGEMYEELGGEHRCTKIVLKKE
jgi:hypothetical protein